MHVADDVERTGLMPLISPQPRALTHLLGGAHIVEQRIPLKRGSTDLGTQRFLLHGPDVAFRLTAYTQDKAANENHLRRLLALTNLKALQWINLNHSQIELTTLTC